MATTAISYVEDEWEYEYDQDVTETFLLDLDLTSLNGGLMSNIAGKRPLRRPGQTGKAKVGSTNVRQQTSPAEDDLTTAQDGPVELQHPFGPSPDSVQALDFASHNPIISYENEVYSCTWSDMVGTNLFFSSVPSVLSGPDEAVELLGTSRIRLVGHRAKVSVKQAVRDESTPRARPERSSDSRAQLTINNPAFKRQADFLERLEDAKKAKGETAVVGTVTPRVDGVSRSTPGC